MYRVVELHILQACLRKNAVHWVFIYHGMSTCVGPNEDFIFAGVVTRFYGYAGIRYRMICAVFLFHTCMAR